jgi:HNH endonuclease
MLEPIAYPPRDVEKRPQVPQAVRARTFVRDRFHCRYCQGWVIHEPIMRLLGAVFPDVFPWHPNWRGGLTHPAVISRSPLVDHVVPGSSGGAWLDPDNLVTACNPCNAIKADFTLAQLGWHIHDIPIDEWDGLISFYQPLWEHAGRPDERYHQSWMRDLGI